MTRLIAHLRRLEQALAADDADGAEALINDLADELGEETAVAIVRRLLDERTGDRYQAAARAAGVELAACA
jgi:HPt (histidine-containing phosphotransfer) domain-containing protein